MRRLAALLVPLILALSGCADKEALKASFGANQPVNAIAGEREPDEGAVGAHKNISMQCSVSVLPLVASAIEEYESRFGSIVDFMAVGRETSIEAVLSGECDFAVFSGGDAIDGLNVHKIGFDGIKLIAHKDSGIDNITAEEIVELFTGQELEINSQAFNLVVLDKQSPVRQIFEEVFPVSSKVNGRMQSMIPADALVFGTDAEVVAAVASDINAIGFIGIGSDSLPVKALTIDGASFEDADGYAAKRAVVLVHMDEKAEPAGEFMDFLNGEGNDIFVHNGFLPLS